MLIKTLRNAFVICYNCLKKELNHSFSEEEIKRTDSKNSSLIFLPWAISPLSYFSHYPPVFFFHAFHPKSPDPLSSRVPKSMRPIPPHNLLFFVEGLIYVLRAYLASSIYFIPAIPAPHHFISHVRIFSRSPSLLLRSSANI